jgi:hypothetical protein
MGIFGGRRKEQRLREAEALRAARKLAAEDVTVLGEELTELHVDTLTTTLDEDMRADYQMALDRYEQAKAALDAADTVEAVDGVATLLVDGRWARARVLARRDGQPLPERREECFFNPQHGPGAFDVSWAPPGGVERVVPVCANDANRLASAEQPDVRMVRSGDRYVPWYAAAAPGTAYSAHVAGDHAPETRRSIAEASTRAGGASGMGGIWTG